MPNHKKSAGNHSLRISLVLLSNQLLSQDYRSIQSLTVHRPCGRQVILLLNPSIHVRTHITSPPPKISFIIQVQQLSVKAAHETFFEIFVKFRLVYLIPARPHLTWVQFVHFPFPVHKLMHNQLTPNRCKILMVLLDPLV